MAIECARKHGVGSQNEIQELKMDNPEPKYTNVASRRGANSFFFLCSSKMPCTACTRITISIYTSYITHTHTPAFGHHLQ